MPAPATVDEFLDLVRKSGVADEKRLDAYLAKLRTDMPADAPKAAGLLVHNGILTNFQAENILAGKWRRFSIGKYKVLERLGSGGFAQVYLCEHKLMRRRVAVKVLPVAKTKDSSALARFHREAQAVAQLDHPNIVQAYDIDQDEDLHFLVMEYIDGANLQEIIKKSGPLSVERACHYIRQAALALQHAHEHGLVHRDIKPGNILVDRTGLVKVLDMGLALILNQEDDQLTKKHDDGTLGTADYLSPEQAMDSHDVDIRTDIYSLGVTFYFLLAGKPPFDGLAVAQKLLAHQMKQPRAISEFRNDVPAPVQAVLDKMMAKKADQRYMTPGDVADALAPFTQDAIAPPADAELPKLSPAATGQPISGDTETTVGKNDTPVAQPRSQPNPGSGNQIAQAVAPPAPPAASPVELPPEEAFATGPFSPGTAPTGARPKKTPIASRSNPIVVFALILAFVIIPIVLTVAIGGVIWFFYQTPAPPTKAGPIKLIVSKDPSQKNAFASIKSALRSAELESTIELWDDAYEETILLEHSAVQRTNITLQAAPGKEIIWRPAPGSDPKQPILTIRRAPDFKLKGKGITFDGTLVDKKGNVNDLIEISLESPGVRVEDAAFKNYARSAVFFMNATGAVSQPIVVQRLTIETTDKTRAAIYLDAHPKIMPGYNDHLEIGPCDFRGHDPARAIQFKDAKVLGKNLRWPGK